NMLFMDDHIQAVLPDLQARRDHCDAILGCLSAGEIIKLTKLGDFTMDGEAKGPLAMLKRLRGSKKKGASGGAKQMALLRRLPKILRFIPGKAQDLRAYFLTMQYWLSGSEDNFENMIRLLVGRYAAGPRAAYQGVAAGEPILYPETGLHHPRAKALVFDDLADLPTPPGETVGTVGLLLMRSYVLSGDAAHYDGVISALEARGLKVIPAFAAGLDSRPAVEAFFMRDGEPTIDALVSLTGFSLVGGPAYNDAAGAEEMLAALDVPYIAAHGIEFQTLDAWEGSDRGLTPVETTMMVAIPELDGATGPIVFGGRQGAAGSDASAMLPHHERVARLADRVAKLVALRTTPAAERRIAITLFNFPPNAGAVGTAAFLSVFESLFATLKALKAAGYAVDLPEDVDALRASILTDPGEAGDARTHTVVPLDDYVRREPYLAEIEAQWGPAPGKALSDGRGIKILGAQFGSVFVGIQP
ncbi:MAG: cobaltochelatase subunit CobN, partial [Pseudomonadota bacterium]